MGVIVCGPPRSVPAWRHIGHCPVCDRRRRLVTTFDGVYYGYTTRCRACLGREMDGDWRPHHGGEYATLDREYVNELWDRGVSHQGFRRAVEDFCRDYWESE